MVAIEKEVLVVVLMSNVQGLGPIVWFTGESAKARPSLFAQSTVFLIMISKSDIYPVEAINLPLCGLT